VSRQARAIRAFEDFKGERPARLRRSRLPDSDVTGWEMGPMLGVAYEARRDGKTAQYFHEFSKSARPRLVAQDDGRKLYIDGGRFKVTDRGIEDMPNLFVVNPSPRSGKTKPKRKGSTMARRARRRRSHVSVFTSNPRRRRRARRSTARRVFARNPAPARRRRRRARTSVARRVYRRNPSRRRARSSVRRRRVYRRNPSGLGGVGKLSSLLMPAVFIGLGAVGTEIVGNYLPIPIAWKTGPMRHVVKAGVGVAVGLLIAKVFKQKRLGYYFAAGAVAIATHDLVKTWLASNSPIKGLGYTNPAAVARFGQYSRGRPPGALFGQYGTRLPSVFGGDAAIPNARQPGGEMNFAA
jgi:hypothetical protein